jgi:hypothetical protein
MAGKPSIFLDVRFWNRLFALPMGSLLAGITGNLRALLKIKKR